MRRLLLTVLGTCRHAAAVAVAAIHTRTCASTPRETSNHHALALTQHARALCLRGTTRCTVPIARSWFADFKALLAQDNIASFITSCIAHEERGTAGWTSLVAGGDSMRDAFAQWHGAVSAGSIPPRTQWIEDSRQLPTNGNRAVCAPLWAESTLRLSDGNHQNAPQHNSQELWARIYRQQHKFEAAEHF